MARQALVTGGTGLLGRAVIRVFEDAGWEVTGTGFTRATPPRIVKLDVLDRNQLEKALDEFKPQVVVHCAAERSPDNCAKDIEAARALNVDATRSLATLTKDRSIFLIYISTDYVFSGKAGEAPYECDDKPSPTNEYGQTKLDGEQAVLDVVGDSGQAICLRVPVLYGSVEEGKNSESAINTLIDTLWKAQKQSDPISMDDYSQRYPTNTTDVGKVCLQIAEKYLAVPEGSQERGKNLPKILQFSSEDRMTKYEICEKFSDWMGLSMENIVAKKEGNDSKAAAVQRPYDTHLSTAELKKLGVDVSTINFELWWRRELRAHRR